jgi:CRISPR-associated protein Csa1
VYFPAPEELRYIQRTLLPETRRQPVAEELRGWNWHHPPLRPAYTPLLAAHEVVSRSCPTSRDLYLQRVEGLAEASPARHHEEHALHTLLTDLITEAKRLIYAYGPHCLPHLERLLEYPLPPTNLAAPAGPDGSLETRLQAVRAFETHRLLERVATALAHYPHANQDALVALALPVHVSVQLDGRYLGFSEQLSVDAIAFREGMVLDVKFGARHPSHRLTTTLYALVLESLYEAPVDLGCVVYVRFVNGRVAIERDFHSICDELRLELIEERDEKQRLIALEADPGLPDTCPALCPYLARCHRAVERPRTASAGPVFAEIRSEAEAETLLATEAL